MLIKGYNSHYRELQKKLFLGEARVLFASTPDDDDNPGTIPGAPSAGVVDAEERKKREKALNLEDWKVLPAHIQKYYDQDSWFVEQARKCVPGKKAYSDEEYRANIEMNWRDALKDYNGLQGFIDHFEKIKKELEDPEFNPEVSKWSGKFQEIYATFEVLTQVKGVKLSDKTKVNIEKAKGKALNEKKEAIRQDLNDIVSSLIQARADILEALEKQMQDDFQTRLKYLKEGWQNKTPRGYEKVKDNWITLIDAGIKDVDLLPSLLSESPTMQGNKRVEAYQTVWEYLTRLEDLYENAQLGHEYEFNMDGPNGLLAEYAELQQIKNKEVDPIADEYGKKVDEAVQSISELITLSTAAMDHEDDPEKKKAMKGQIDEWARNVTKLTEGRNISERFQAALDSEDPHKTQDPNKPVDLDNPEKNKIPYEISLHGSDVKIIMKKGLKHQIELLRQLPFSEEEQRQFALGLKQAIDVTKNGMKAMKNELTQTLPQLINDVNIAKRDLKPELGMGGWKFHHLAYNDVNQFIHIIGEWGKRRYDATSKMRIGEVGEKATKFLKNSKIPLPGTLGALRGIPGEFGKEHEHAMHGEYTHFKEIYASADMFHVEHIAHTTHNKEELKGCLLLLAENGRLNWYKPPLWRQLNKPEFQNAVRIPIDMRYNLANYSKFQDSLRRACGTIWDFDSFNSMNNSNNSAFDSKKSAFTKDCDTWAEQGAALGRSGKMLGGLSLVIDDLLHTHKQNPGGAKVDPIKYEAIIDYGITKGKMDPEGKLYYLIQGIANGILPPDRGSALNSKFVNDYPAIEYFASPTDRGSRPTMEDLQEVSLMDMEQFYDWYHVYVMNLPKVYQRLNKTLTQGNKLDHDDLTPTLAYMTEETTKIMLKSDTSGAAKLPQTGIQNATVGMLFFMDHIAENYGRINKAQAEKEIGRFVGSFVTFDGILSDRMHRGQNYYHWDQTALNEVPRSSGNYASMYGRSKKMSSKDNLAETQKYIMALDPDFFGPLFRGEVRGNSDVARLVDYVYKKYDKDAFGTDTLGKPVRMPTSVDELYQVVGAFANTLAKKRPERVQTMLSAVQADHVKLYKDMGKDGITMEARRRKYSADLKHHRTEDEKRRAGGDMDIHILGYEHEHGGGHGGAHVGGAGGGGHGGHAAKGDHAAAANNNEHFGGGEHAEQHAHAA